MKTLHSQTKDVTSDIQLLKINQLIEQSPYLSIIILIGVIKTMFKNKSITLKIVKNKGVIFKISKD